MAIIFTTYVRFTLTKPYYRNFDDVSFIVQTQQLTKVDYRIEEKSLPIAYF